MPREKILAQLQQLREELAQADGLDVLRQQRIETLMSQLEQELDGEFDPDSLVDQWEQTFIEFEASHPTVAGVVKKVMETLANIGV